MPKDEQYEIVKFLIEQGKITELGQIFRHIPKKVLASDLNTSTRHLTRIQNNPEIVTIKEMFAFSEVIGVSVDDIYRITKQQYSTKKNTPVKKTKKAKSK